MTKQHEEWINRGQEDIRFAKLGLREGFYSQVCFLSQQAIEKLLKGMLIFLQRPYPKSHSLLELSKKVPELSLEDWQERLTILDGYYVPLRYPDAAPGSKSTGLPNKKEACDALQTAEEIFEAMLKYMHE